MPTAPQSAAYRTAERALPGRNLERWLRDRVDDGDSARTISRHLQDMGVIVSHDAVNNWLRRFGMRPGGQAS